MTVIRPKTYLPMHWNRLWDPFADGRASPFAGRALEAYPREAAVEPVVPGQFMDQWRLDATGIQPRNNAAMQEALGFSVLR